MSRPKIELSIGEKKAFFMARLRGKSFKDCATELGICYATAQKIPEEKWYQELVDGTEAFISASLEMTKRKELKIDKMSKINS